MTMLDIIKADIRRMKDIATMNGDFDVVEAIEETMTKIEYYEKGVDEALCAMEKSWKARDEPRIEIKSPDQWRELKLTNNWKKEGIWKNE